MVELLQTKLFIPRPRTNLVLRPRLVERLNAGLERKLTLIAAPAGFGKTTVLSEWVPQSPHCVTWLSLDEADNDPTKFWMYVIGSLQRLSPDIGAGALTLLESPQPPPIHSVLTSLLNDVTAFPNAFSIVLDDYHAIDAEAIHQALTFVLTNLPSNMHLIITTRADPPLPLARLRARDQLIELRANDLSFTSDEAAAFLSEVMGLQLSNQEINALETRTEGWIAGLQIAGLSLRGRDDVPDFIQTFSGSHRYILGYLAEEVLNRQPEDTVQFLVQTSILERMCGALCDAVTGASDGQTKLEQLERAHLFLFPLDDKGKWYRYHHLFAQVLQQRCRQRYPDAMSELHRRASEWFEQANLIEEALRHALAAGDQARAAHLVETYAVPALARGEMFVVRGWLEQFSPETILSRPRLVLIQARILNLTGKLDEADQLLNRFVAQSDERTLPDVVRGEMEQVRASVARFRGEMRAALVHSKQALALLAPNDYDARSRTLTNMSLAYLELGEPDAVNHAFQEIIAFGEDAAPLFVWRACSFLAWFSYQRGQSSAAAQDLPRVIRQAEKLDRPPAVILGMAHYVLGEFAYERNDLENAQAHIESAISYLEHTIEQVFLAMSYGKLIRILQVTSDDAAAKILERAETWLARMNMQDSGFSTILASERAWYWMRQGKLELAARWAGGLGSTQTHSSKFARTVRDFVLARIYLALEKYADALAILDGIQSFAEPKQWSRFLFQIDCLRALVWWRQGNSHAAFEILENALARGEAGGYLRAWLDEGEPMRELLLAHQVRAQNARREKTSPTLLAHATYLNNVLAAFPESGSDAKPKTENSSDALNEREREILKLIAAGYSNREIADKLMLAQSTVKWYINNLYSKLGAKSRTSALALAKEMDLI